MEGIWHAMEDGESERDPQDGHVYDKVEYDVKASLDPRVVALHIVAVGGRYDNGGHGIQEALWQIIPTGGGVVMSWRHYISARSPTKTTYN